MNACIITPCYAPAELVEAVVINRKKYFGMDLPHYLLGNHWPFENVQKIKDIADRHGCIFFDNEYDRGLHLGLNNWLEKEGKSFDCMIGIDPDSSCLNPDYGKALFDIMQSGEFGVLALWGVGIEINQYKISKKEEVNGYNIAVVGPLEMWNMAAYNLDLIRSIGGFYEPNAFYGSLEIGIGHKIQEKKKIGYLCDYKESYSCYDEIINKYQKEWGLYREWKDAHLSGFKDDFGNWLKVMGKLENE